MNKKTKTMVEIAEGVLLFSGVAILGTVDLRVALGAVLIGGSLLLGNLRRED